MRLELLVPLAVVALTAVERASAAPDSPSAVTAHRGLTHVVVSDDEPSRNVDGVYGRLDGDFSGALSLGASFLQRPGDVGAAVQGTLYYYWTIAIYAKYADRLSSVDAASARRAYGGGLELRPTFLLRWSRDLEHGPAFWDLTLDSLHAIIGLSRVEFGRAQAALGAELGLGFGVPLTSSALGFWLEARGSALLEPDRAALPMAALLLAWHGSIDSPWLED